MNAVFAAAQLFGECDGVAHLVGTHAAPERPRQEALGEGREALGSHAVPACIPDPGAERAVAGRRLC